MTGPTQTVAGGARSGASTALLPVDFWFDPVCPYSWTASRWLLEVERLRPIRIEWHLMSLYALNETRTDDPAYVDYLRTIDGGSRMLAVVAEGYGNDTLRELYTDLGSRLFDTWRRAGETEFRRVIAAALAARRLPANLIDAYDSEAAAALVRRSHDEGMALVGADSGTPITRIGSRAFYGPVLNGIPRGRDAVRIFDATRLLAAEPHFYELKRTRTTVPVFT